MKIVACIVARTVSTRLPLKILRDLVPGVSMIEFLIQNLKHKGVVDSIYLCTSRETPDDILEDIAVRNDVNIYRGSADDVTERLLAVGAIEEADVLVRITGDNPFSFVEYIPYQLGFLQENKLDYVRLHQVPIGASCEVFTRQALEKCVSMMDPAVSEYLMLFLFEPRNFRCGLISIVEEDFSSFSLTVDNPEDLVRTRMILKQLSFNGVSYNRVLAETILDIIKRDRKLPARTYQMTGMVKMPYGESITFGEFKLDMERRVQAALQLQVYG